MPGYVLQPSDLKQHKDDKHFESHKKESDDDGGQPSTEGTEDSTEATEISTENFSCERCKLPFKERHFLENHQRFFCRHRYMVNNEDAPVVNEQ